jgi:hypothetical protein
MATLIVTAKLNDVDPQAWLADVLARIADHTIQDLDQLSALELESERSQTRRLTAATRGPHRRLTPKQLSARLTATRWSYI